MTLTLAYAPGDPNAGRNPEIASAAYTNNRDLVTRTFLYGIDSDANLLARQGTVTNGVSTPNDGQLFSVDRLGVNTTGETGFDVSGDTGEAYAILTPSSPRESRLYKMNLGGGQGDAADLIGRVGGFSRRLRGLTIIPDGVAFGSPDRTKSFVEPIGSSYSFDPLLSVGERVDETSDPSKDYQMVGIPDGLGLSTSTVQNTVTEQRELLMNHELGQGVVSEATVGGAFERGAFVSKYQLGADGTVLSGERAYDTVLVNDTPVGPAPQADNPATTEVNESTPLRALPASARGHLPGRPTPGSRRTSTSPTRSPADPRRSMARGASPWRS